MPPTRGPQLARAHAAATRGDLRTAASLYQQIIQRHPDAHEAHHALGMILVRAERHRPALDHLQKAADLQPTNPAYHYALAKQLATMSRFAPALAAYNKARWLNPNHAEAHIDAATILEKSGKLAEARHAAGRALDADPAHARARIVATRLDLRTTDAPDHDTLTRWRDDLRAAADRAETPFIRAIALDVLIDVCERLERFDEAWTAIEQCNEADRTLNAGQLAAPEQRASCLDTIDTLARFATPERARRYLDQCPDDGLPTPALLVGFPRSGTTMTERALDAHPRIRSIEEQSTFELTRARIPRIVPNDLLAANPAPRFLDALAAEHVGALRRAYWDRACAALDVKQPPTETIVLDKMPLRITDLIFVNRIFPRAKVLVALRDPRDVCLSCIRQRFGYARNIPMSFFLTPEDTATLYTHVMNSWLTARDAYTLDTMQIRYEDTVADFEPRLRDMLRFLHLEWNDAVLSSHSRTDRIHSTPSYHAVSRKVSTRAVGRWRRYESHLAPILPALQPLVDALGYPESASPT